MSLLQLHCRGLSWIGDERRDKGAAIPTWMKTHLTGPGVCWIKPQPQQQQGPCEKLGWM